MGLYGGQITCLAVDPTDSRIMYAGSWGGDGLFKTIDAGATWFTIPQDLPSWFRNQEIQDIELDPNDPNTVWVANAHYADVSHDGGQSWKKFFFASDEDRFCWSVAVDPFDSDTVYVGTGGPGSDDKHGEMFTTRDGGSTWNKLNFNLNTWVLNNFLMIKCNPNKQGEVWAVNGKYDFMSDVVVLVSADYARSWHQWDKALFGDTYYPFDYSDEVLVHPANPLRIFLCTYDGIAVKTDGSISQTSWHWALRGNRCYSLCIPPKEPSTIYASLPEAMAKSTDNGVTWDATSLAVPCEFLTMEPHPDNPAVLFAGSLNQGFYTTTDRAQNWTARNNGIKANAIFDTALDPSHAGTLLCGTLAGIFLKSADTLQQINTGWSRAVAFHPTNPNIIYAGFDYKIGKSSDRGATWTYLDTPDQAIPNEIVSLAIDPTGANSATIYAALSCEPIQKGWILKMQDNGGPIDTAAWATVFKTSEPVHAVALKPLDPSVIIAGTGSFYAPGAPGGIYISSDGGQTWRKKLLTSRFTVNCIAFDPADPETIYAGCGESGGTYQGLLKSTNGGKTWRTAHAGLPPDFSVSDIKVADDGSGFVYAALFSGSSDSQLNLGGIYVSANGGEYWTRIGLTDYWTSDVSIESPRAEKFSRKAHTFAAAASIPTCTVYAGTASGLLTQDQSTIAGLGIVSGMICSTGDNKTLINEAYVSSTAGTGAQSNHGFYLMYVPSGQHSIQASAPGYIQVSSSTVYVNAGESTELNITMTPSGTDGFCISEQLLQAQPDSSHLQPLRAFRDSILNKTAYGRSIISQYYSLGRELLPVLQGNPRLKTRCIKLLGAAAQIARTAEAGRPLSLPPGFMDKASAFFMELEQASPAAQRQKIKELRSSLRQFRYDRLQKNPDSA
ncbi:MAG: hypothetical protein NTX06_05660 [Proteobacteria bacterium]|nr:hypothetical protein [Pseudomonadota bacterium]